MNECEICGRDALKDNFCRYHYDALINLKKAYDGWKRATGIDWEMYMDRLLQIEETGRWVIDVIEYFRQQDGSLEEL
jgi:hypothetical protein